jgi:carbonic anhydrase
VLRWWALLGRLGQGEPPGGYIVILDHTDCGIRRLGAHPEQLAAFFEIPVPELDSKFADDPCAVVRLDIGITRAAIPPSLRVSGMVYDVHTGLVQVVEPATTD